MRSAASGAGAGATRTGARPRVGSGAAAGAPRGDPIGGYASEIRSSAVMAGLANGGGIG